MAELQAAIEFQVELLKFYNVDLFQRGYYQLRASLKTSPKVASKIDVSLPHNVESSLDVPASVLDGVAISKTFQILYRKEEIILDDVILFKAYIMVDPDNIEQSVTDADFQMDLELWFTDDDLRLNQMDKFTSVSQRNIKLHLSLESGLHHHIPVLFDYFHLASAFVTIHGALVAIHQPYIGVNRPQPKSSTTVRTEPPSMEFILFGTENPTATAKSVMTACHRHSQICKALLVSYEGIQHSYELLLPVLPANEQIPISHVDCQEKFEEMALKCQKYAREEKDDLLQVIQADLAHLCAQNVILWMQFLEQVSLNEKVTRYLAREHHLQRIKRFAEGFLILEHPKQDMVACFDSSIHNHAEVANLVRTSSYYQSLLSLQVECLEMDGDSSSLPIIFEDIYTEPNPKRIIHCNSDTLLQERAIDVDSDPCGRFQRNNSLLERRKGGRMSSSSSGSEQVTSPKFKHPGKVKAKDGKRPTSFNNNSTAGNAVAMDQKHCVLVGYRKTESNVEAVTLGLGTLNSDVPLPGRALCTPASSMPCRCRCSVIINRRESPTPGRCPILIPTTVRVP